MRKWVGIKKIAEIYRNTGSKHAETDFRKAMMAGAQLARGQHAGCFYSFDANINTLIRRIEEGDYDDYKF